MFEPASPEASREAWRAARSFADLCELGARFVEGKIAFFPGWNAPDLDVESDEIARVLARLCRAGFLTVASQPARPMIGGGGQRAFVAGFATPELARALRRSVSEDLVFVVHEFGAKASADEEGGCLAPVARISRLRCLAPPEPVRQGEPVSLHDGVAHAFAGHDARAEEIVCFEDHIAAEALAELSAQAWVSAYDMQWGRTDTLWNHIERVLDDAGH
jgi:hypothetical protein